MSINLNEMMEEYARLPFVPLRAFFERWSPEDTWSHYTTQSAAFHFPLKGQAQFHMGGNSLPFLPGKVIHGASGKWLETQVENGLTCEFLTIFYIYEGNDADYMHNPYELEIGVNSQLISMLWRMVELCKAPNAQSRLQFKSLMYSVLSETFASAQIIRQDDAHSIVTDAKAYMEQHYMESCSLCQLGSRYGMNSNYFADVFKRHIGITPNEYLISCRLEQARKLLIHTECDIKEIGKSVGYEDSSYFSRHFKSRLGLSPKEYRGQGLLHAKL